MSRFVGNVTKGSEITFEYGVRQEFKRKQREKKKHDKLRVSTVLESPEGKCEKKNK